MRILAIEPYYGGSHRAFIDGWIAHSRHDFDLVTFEPHHWKWRMRHAAASAAQSVEALLTNARGGTERASSTPDAPSRSAPAAASPWDALWCSSMLDLATFRGLTHATLGDIPSVLYFHENQLDYPTEHPDARDVHFAFTHWTGMLAAHEVWFNSEHNRATSFEGLRSLFRKMPDHRGIFDAARLTAKSKILPPGINPVPNATRHAQAPVPVGAEGANDTLSTHSEEESPDPIRLAWAARWEHDKGPELLLATLRLLKMRGVRFRLSLLGERFKNHPEAFFQIQREFGEDLDAFGFAPSRSEYERHLLQSDVFVSTARHEYFGIAVMEAAAAGCQLLLPRALAYPELIADPSAFYDGTTEGLAQCVEKLSQTRPARGRFRAAAERHFWTVRAPQLDSQLQAMTAATQ